MRIGRIIKARGFSKTNKNLTRRGWGKSLCNFRIAEFFSAEFKISADR